MATIATVKNVTWALVMLLGAAAPAEAKPDRKILAAVESCTSGAAKRPPRWEGQHYFGPGAADDKGGGVIAICALSALRTAGVRPPWPRAASTDQLLARANRLYGEIGRSLTGVSVGSSADVAFAAESGKPAIDGFGMEGAGAHGPDEYADFATLTPRAYLLARMLMDLGRNPPR